MRNATRVLGIVLLSIISCTALSVSSHAGFRIGIMQDKRGAAAKLRPLLKYLRKKGVEASFVGAKSYSRAAVMFDNGEVDGMFSGSGVAGCIIIKDLGYPVVSPVSKGGWSTYKAVVLAPKGSPRFTRKADYFTNKRVIFCSLASSGEFFYRSIIVNADISATILKASSHGAAIDALSRGAADVAIVKNRVWDQVKGNYVNIIQAGEDMGENPNFTLIASTKTEPALVKKISSVLLGLKEDKSAEAIAVKERMEITGFIKTTIDDFKFTISLLKRAGVDKAFNF